MKATLVHIENGIEYYVDGNLTKPTFHQKALWLLFGTPENVEIIEETFRTEIDEIVGFTKKEIQAKFKQNLENGNYSFLPAMDLNNSLELEF